MEENLTLGNVIRKRRKELGLTIKELAQKVDLSEQAISQYELDKRVPDEFTLVKISRALNIASIKLLSASGKDTEDIKLFYDTVTTSLTDSINKKYYDKLSADDIKKMLAPHGLNLNTSAFENMSSKDKQDFINDLAKINPFTLKVPAYIDNFDNFTKEDLINLTNEALEYGIDLVSSFIENYYEPQINELVAKINSLEELNEEARDLIINQKKIIELQKEQLTIIENALKGK
ncbi:helix-turn-helix domain-containing protein [Clostridium sp. UBA1652]|uniref:helix-turn-helix domain-containing protein n=1 Tax=Clostridium sp. UBA1652 TaxID=1946348 RepID=UPI00257D6E78|nr:helix-turn-helix transcriptional regulator [Clostridium sp. UBA1652]